MPLFTPENLLAIGQDIFEAAGVPRDTSEEVAASLVRANLAGIDSHGVIRIPQYIGYIDSGQIDPKAKPFLLLEKPLAVLVDGAKGFGQPAARFCMEKVIAKGKQNGLAAGGLRRTNHVGRVGDYLLPAARKGLIGLAYCNGCTPNVAPFGAMERILGTNPIACAVPTKNGDPLLIDLATSLATEGKTRLARNREEPLDNEMILDPHGKPTTDPNDFYNGGVLLPIGRHKGSALSLMIEILGGLLTGAGTPSFPDHDRGNGLLLLVLDPGLFRDPTDFLGDVESLKNNVKRARVAPAFDEILLPGEAEARNERQRREAGICVDDGTWNEIVKVAERFGIKGAPHALFR